MQNALDSVHLTLGTISSSDGVAADDSAVVLAQKIPPVAYLRMNLP